MEKRAAVAQHQIKRTLSAPAALLWIAQRLSTGEDRDRTAVATAVCQQYGFRDARGQLQLASCLQALRRLEAAGHIALPLARCQPRRGTPRRLAAPVPPPEGVPAEAGLVSELQLVLVTTPDQLALWNELMLGEHPRGAGPLVGRQLRYLVGSAHGWLGGLGFSAAALQLADRDRWIGWPAEQRRAYLDRVVCLSRFLIRPSVDCRNLASQVLGMSLRALPADFQRQYHYPPWLVESFVDPSQFSGTCYQASNWLRIGQTQGRGRQDRQRLCGETKKDIYVYVLAKDFRRRMGLLPAAGGGPLTVGTGLEGDGWAVQEFGGADLGDARLSQRLVHSAQVRAREPGGRFTGVRGGDWPTIKGYYRLIDQPAGTTAVSLETMLAPHQRQTRRRMQSEQTVLCLQDGTDLNYHHLAHCTGLGVIGTNQTGTQSRGLHLHTTLAVAPNGLPLGVLQAQCWAPPAPDPDAPRPAAQRHPEEKESFCWLEGLRQTAQAAAQMPHTRLIMVGDRGADFFTLFDEQRRHPEVELLVRANDNRLLVDARDKLFAAVRQAPLMACVTVSLEHQSERPKRSKKQARAGHPKRLAVLALRYQQVTFQASDTDAHAAPITLWVIHAVEQEPPAGHDPVEWFLLTTLTLRRPEQAIECLRWYCLRWRIEDWHRVLKSGCRVEALAHDTAERLQRAIALELVIAWRLMLLALLGRQTPDLPAALLFSELQLEVLTAVAEERCLAPPVTLGDAILLVARLGGYTGRRRDPPPGHQVMWCGHTILGYLSQGYALCRDRGRRCA